MPSHTRTLALATVAWAACAEPPTGGYHATWTLADGDLATSCEAAAVATIFLEVRDLATNEVRDVAAPCAAGEATVPDVPNGEHRLAAVARGNHREVAGRATVTTRLDATTIIDAPLMRIPIAAPTTVILFNWQLERAGAPLRCEVAGATTVQVVATPDDGRAPIEARWPCAPRAEFMALPVGAYELAATLRSADGEVLATTTVAAVAPLRGQVDRVFVFRP
jgi:hypothetical protein